MKKCKKCGYPQTTQALGKIWLSDEGLCSICNRIAKYKKVKKKSKKIWEYYKN